MCRNFTSDAFWPKQIRYQVARDVVRVVLGGEAVFFVSTLRDASGLEEAPNRDRMCIRKALA